MPENPDYYTDCLQNRVAPGAGEFDVMAFIDAVRSTGCSVPMSLEVCSQTGWEHPESHVRDIAAGLRALVAGGREPV